MHSPKVSIIVPVYKAEKYLERCINSIRNQTFRDFELILIDDGSPDNSGRICDEFVKKDNRIKVVHKRNGGVSSARNAGIEIAIGEKIGFVDSDDFVSEKYIEHLLKGDADLCVSGLTWSYSEENREICIPSNINTNNINSKINEFLNILYDRYLDGPYQKLYKKEVIDKINLRFDDRLALGEDTIFVLRYFLEADSIYVCSYSDYNHDMTPDASLSKIRHNSEATRLFAVTMYDLLDKIKNKYNIDNTHFEGYLVDKFLTYIFMGWYTLYYKRYAKAERLRYLKKIKEEILERDIKINNYYISKKNKLAYLILCKFPIFLGDKVMCTIVNIKNNSRK